MPLVTNLQRLPYILGLGTCVPAHGAPQMQVIEAMIPSMEMTEKRNKQFLKIGENSGRRGRPVSLSGCLFVCVSGSLARIVLHRALARPPARALSRAAACLPAARCLGFCCVPRACLSLPACMPFWHFFPAPHRTARMRF